MAVYKRDMVDINLETGNIHRSFLKHSIGFKDAAADHFGIRVFRNGEPVSLTGVSVQGIFMPPQGSPIAITSGNIVSENEAEVVLPQACYNYDGQFTLSIKLVDATNAVTGTMRIVDGMVDNTHASGTVAPTSAVPTYQEILATYDAMVAATTAATTAATNVGSIVAAAYSTSATYAVGDYCTKDGNLYRCTTAITTAESWTAAHWTQTKMGPDVSDLKSAMRKTSVAFSNGIEEVNGGKVYGFESGYINLNYTIGSVVSLTVTDNSSTVHEIIECSAGEKYSVNLDGGISARAYGILDSDKKLLAVTGQNTDYQGTITIPSNGAYLILNTDIGIDYYAYKEPGLKGVVDNLIGENGAKFKTDDYVENTSDKMMLDMIVPRFYSGYYNMTAIGTTMDISLPIPNNSIFCTIIEIDENYLIYVDGIVGAGSSSGGARAYAFLDDEYTVLDRASAGVTYNKHYFTNVPTGAKYLVLNTTQINGAFAICYDGFLKSLKLMYNDINRTITSYEEYQLANATIGANGRWVIGSNYQGCLIPVGNGYNKTITIKAHGINGSMVSLLKSCTVGSHGTVPLFAEGETNRHVVSAGNTVTLHGSADCLWLFVTLTSSGNGYAPQTITISMKENIVDGMEGRIAEIEEEIRNSNISSNNDTSRVIALNSSNHDIPQNKGVLNAYKKIHQMEDIEWNALSAIPGSGSATAISAGQHTGLPYSSVKEYDKYIGWNVSFKTFMTAVHNPYSLLYTEDVLGSRSTSGYGITYHGVNCGAYFGIVCNILALYGLGWEIPWNTAEFAYLYSIGKLEKAYDQTADGIRLMDLIWEPGHANIIIDIERNDYGEPVYLWWAESVSYFPKLHKYTPEEVNNRLTERGGIIYYDPNIYKNLNYIPNPFVSVMGETPETYQYNDDICTYAGDYACFNGSDDVWINYTAGSYTQMEIYKDNTLLSTISIDTSAHKVKITTSGYGKYKARLKNGSNYSDYTYFEIVDTTVTASYINGLLTVDFSSSNGEPLYAQLTYRSGKSLGIIEMTDAEKDSGTISFSPTDILNAQYPGETFDATTYIKVFFKGDYGVVPNAYLDTGIVS